jgi:hypothetical protein
MQDFWQNMGFDGASAPGMTGIDRQPYTLLSQGTTVMAQKVLDDAAALFPEYDGITNVPPRLPDDFSDPSPQSFGLWHTAAQVAYLKAQEPDWQTKPAVKTFGNAASAFDNQTWLLSADGRSVINVNTLQTTDIARLSLADQTRLAELPAFIEIHADPKGLWPSSANGVQTGGAAAPPATVAEARARIQALITEFEELVKTSSNYSAANRGDPVTSDNLAQRYPNLFFDQIDILRRRVDNMAIFSFDAIGQLVSDLQKRFLRIERYATVTQPQPDTRNLGMTFSANSTDNLAGVKRALNIFLRSEVQQRDIAAAKNEIVVLGTLNGRVLDTPNMIFVLQTQDNYAKEAEARAQSEELNQINSLVQSYTGMQKMLNTTLTKFDPVKFQENNKDDFDKKNEKQPFLGLTGINFLDTDGNPISAADRNILSMFERSYVLANNNKFHPFEQEKGTQRPAITVFGDVVPGLGVPGSFSPQTQKEWDLASQNLAKVSKILSQESQLQMDRINALSREKNRNYDIATETLTKMTDILRSIVN